MKRFKIVLAYDGVGFKGFQKQIDERTVQGELEKCLSRITKEEISVTASGRTDAGVHAINQVCHFDTNLDISSDELLRAMNSLLPDDIYIKKVEEVDFTFHARFSAKSREYIYKLNMGEYDPFSRNYIFQYNAPLDVTSMQRAISYFEGVHDFTSFCSQEKEERINCERHIIETGITKENNIITFKFVGNGFLRHMIRIMVGTLIEVGSGKRPPEDILRVLNAKNRELAGKTVDPSGLYLKDVNY
jgi:tRNA pseudouridine38-40 synthase